MSASSDYFNNVIEGIESESDRITLDTLRIGYAANVGQSVAASIVFHQYRTEVFFWDDETLGDLRNTIRDLRDHIENW